MSQVLVYVLNLLVVAGVTFGIYRYLPTGYSRRVYWPAWIIKLTCGLVLGMIYHFHYGSGDTLIYYHNASILAAQPWGDFWAAIFTPTISSDPVRAIYFERMLAVLLYFTRADYWMASLYFSLVSFLGSLYLIEQIVRFRPSFSQSAALSFIFLPSICFWSSGLLKESLAFAALAFFIGFYVKIVKVKVAAYDWMGVVISVGILGLLKSYVLMVSLPIYLVLLQDHYFKSYQKNWLGTYPRLILLSAISLPIIYFSFVALFPNFHWNQLFHDIEVSRQDVYQNSIGTKVYSFTGMAAFDPLTNFFHYLFAGLFRPVLFESWDFPVWISAVENALISILLIWKLWAIARIRMSFSLEGLMTLIYVLFLAFALAYSLPNLGTISRMKVYYLPFLMLLILHRHPAWDHLRKLPFLR